MLNRLLSAFNLLDLLCVRFLWTDRPASGPFNDGRLAFWLGCLPDERDGTGPSLQSGTRLCGPM